MLDKVIIKDLGDGLVIPFVCMDKTPGGSNLDHAEFGFVINFKKDGRVKFHIFALRQHHIKKYLYIPNGDIDFTIRSEIGLPKPEIWMVHRSVEPNGTCLRVYPPSESSYLYVDYHGATFYKVKPNYGKIFRMDE